MLRFASKTITMAMIAGLAAGTVAYAAGTDGRTTLQPNPPVNPQLPSTTYAPNPQAPKQAQVGASQPQYFPWQDPKYTECGQSCLYQKANENLSLQALTVLNTADRLNSEFNQNLDEEVITELKDYCPDKLDTGRHAIVSHDNAQVCLERYFRVQVPVLQQIRAALSYNESSAAALRSNAMVVGAYVDPSAPKKLPQTPYIPTTKDLEAEHGKLAALSAPSYEKWLKEVQGFKPSCNDFPKTHKIPRDPSNPNGEQMTIIDRNPDGTVKCDDGPYKMAVVEYQNHIKTMKSDLGTLVNQGYGAKVMAGQQQVAKGPNKINDWTYAQPVVDTASGNMPMNQANDYRQARFEMVRASDSILGANGKYASRNTLNYGQGAKKSQAPMSPDAADRAIAAETQPDTSKLDPSRGFYTVSFSQDELAKEIAALNSKWQMLSGGGALAPSTTPPSTSGTTPPSGSGQATH